MESPLPNDINEKPLITENRLNHSTLLGTIDHPILLDDDDEFDDNNSDLSSELSDTPDISDISSDLSDIPDETSTAKHREKNLITSCRSLQTKVKVHKFPPPKKDWTQHTLGGTHCDECRLATAEEMKKWGIVAYQTWQDDPKKWPIYGYLRNMGYLIEFHQIDMKDSQKWYFHPDWCDGYPCQGVIKYCEKIKRWSFSKTCVKHLGLSDYYCCDPYVTGINPENHQDMVNFNKERYPQIGDKLLNKPIRLKINSTSILELAQTRKRTHPDNQTKSLRKKKKNSGTGLTIPRGTKSQHSKQQPRATIQSGSSSSQPLATESANTNRRDPFPQTILGETIPSPTAQRLELPEEPTIPIVSNESEERWLEMRKQRDAARSGEHDMEERYIAELGKRKALEARLQIMEDKLHLGKKKVDLGKKVT